MKLLAAMCLGLLMACGPSGSEASSNRMGGAASGLEEKSSVDTSASSIDFGEQRVGTSAVQTLVVRNTGSTEFKVTSISINGNAFSVSPSAPFTLPPASSYNLSVSFTPTAEGAVTGNLTLTTNDPDHSTLLVSLSGKGVKPQLVVTPSTLDFGAVRVGTSAGMTMTMSNRGSGRLTLTSISLGTTPFSLPSPPPLPMNLSPGEALSLTVFFKPSSETPATDNIKISSNDPDQPTVAVALSGRGVKPQLVLEPSALDFGSVGVGKSVSATVKLTNPGSGPVTLVSLTLSGDSSFSLSPPPSTPFTLAPGASQSVSVRFLADSEGTFSATLAFSTDDPDTSRVVLPLSGTAVKPHLIASSSALDFGSLLAGNSSKIAVQLTNVGSGNAILKSISLMGTSSSFSLPTPPALPLVLGPGGNQTVLVSFAPTAQGTFKSSLVIVSDDPDAPTLSIPVTGTGMAAVLSLSSSTLDFGAQAVGTTTTHPVTVSNIGSIPLHLAEISLSAGAPFSVPSTGPLDLKPGISQEFQVSFTPTAEGSFEATLKFTSDSATGPESLVHLTGMATRSRLLLGPDSLEFGTQRVGRSGPAQKTTLYNTGSAPLHVSAISLTVGAPFTVTPSTAFDLAPGAHQDLSVMFTPASEGDFKATLTLGGDKEGAASGTVELSGTGAKEEVAATGCSSTSTAGPGLLGALALLLLGARRTRAH